MFLSNVVFQCLFNSLLVENFFNFVILFLSGMGSSMIFQITACWKLLSALVTRKTFGIFKSCFFPVWVLFWLTHCSLSHFASQAQNWDLCLCWCHRILGPLIGQLAVYGGWNQPRYSVPRLISAAITDHSYDCCWNYSSLVSLLYLTVLLGVVSQLFSGDC